MKKLLLLATLGVTLAPAVAQTNPEQSADPYLKFPVYVLTMQDLTSEYAKQKYPPVKITVPKVTQTVTYIQTADQALYNSLKTLQAWNGRVDRLRLLNVTNAITEDLVINEQEALILELIKNQTPFMFALAATVDFKPRPAGLTPKPDEATIERLKTFQENGIELQTHEVMSRKLMRADKFGDWVKLFKGGETDHQLALSLLRRRFILSTGTSTVKNNYGPARRVLSEIINWTNTVPAEERMTLKTLIYDDLNTTNTALGASGANVSLEILKR